MHKYVQKHIRLEAIRIYQASVRHEQCCRRPGCLFALSQYNSVALAFGHLSPSADGAGGRGGRRLRLQPP